MLSDELQAYLDGELERDELPPELREEARQWDELTHEMRAATGGELSAPRDLEREVMRALPEHPEVPWWRRAVEWLLRPRTVEVSPLAGAAAAAALVLAVLVPVVWTMPSAPLPEGGPTADGGRGTADAGPASTVSAGENRPRASEGRVYVQFRLRAPDAGSVAVAGDFTDWDPAYYLSDVDGDGVWTGRVPLTPGLHEYMFVVDGSEWVTDPGAERYVDDGFGHRNAVVTITST
jgi:hypothetical protein